MTRHLPKTKFSVFPRTILRHLLYYLKYCHYLARLLLWKMRFNPQWRKATKIAGVSAVSIALLASGISLYRWYSSIPRAPKLEVAPSDSPYLFQARGKEFQAQIGKKKTNVPAVEFSVGNSKITFSPASGKALIEEPVKEEKKLTFKNVYSNIDFVYQTTPKGIKEDIVIRQAQEVRTFPFFLEFEGAAPQYVTENLANRVFYDAQGNYLFHFEKPYAEDATGTRSDKVQLLVKRDKNSGKYAAIVSLDPDWLSSPSRVYPVFVDPSIVHDTSSEFATGQFNRVKDTGSGASPNLETFYQELPADEHTVGLWHMNETADNTCTGGVNDVCDSSGNGNDGAATGTTIDTTNQRLGDAARTFNGSSDFINVGDISLLESFPVTVEAWVKTSSATDQTIYSEGNTSVDNAFGRLQLESTGKVRWNFENGASSLALVGNTVINDGSWHHVVGVSESTTSHRVYVDGKLDGSSTTSFTPATTHNSANIGRLTRLTPIQYFNGTIDEIRLSNRALSPEEIKLNAQRRPYSIFASASIDLGANLVSLDSLQWTELGVQTGDGETLSDSTSLVAQWNLNETSGTTAANAAGSCGASCNGTLTGFSDTTGQDVAAGSGWTSDNRRWGAGALMFDGSNDFVTMGNPASLQFERTDTFSLETWFVYLGDDGSLIGKHQSDGNNMGYTIMISGGKLHVRIIGSNGAGITFTGGTSLQQGTYYHAVLTYDGSSTLAGTKLYLNGIQETKNTTTDALTTSIATSAHFEIGARGASTGSGADNPTKANVDSSRVYSRVLTASEILSNYQAGNIEFQTRTSADASTWEEWRPVTNETQIESMDTSFERWKKDYLQLASTMIDTISAIDEGDGADGEITVATNKNINTDDMISGRSCADGGDAVYYSDTTLEKAGETTVTLSATPSSGCLAAGDEILIINLQGTSSNNGTVGQWETHDISSITTNTITLDEPLHYTYDGTTQKILVQRVPNYTNVTVNSAVTLIADDWDGTGGGVLFFRANGTVTVTGNINLDGKGYRGGSGGSTGGGTNGESYDGTVGSGGDDTVSGSGGGNAGTSGGGSSSNYDTISPAGTRGGGGGGGNADASQTFDGSGGGGGGGYGGGGGGGGGGADSGTGGSGGSGGSTGVNAGGGGGGGNNATANGGNGGNAGSAGSTGGGANCNPTICAGGAAGSGTTTGQGGAGGNTTHTGLGAGGAGAGGNYGTPSLSSIFLGSGGGGGGGHDNGPTSGQNGGDGGGIIIIAADTVTVTGTIAADGAAGTSSSNRAGASGGGSGGSVLIQASTATLGSSLITATGGSSASASSHGGGGGAGGVGRIAVYYTSSISGTTNPSAHRGIKAQTQIKAEGNAALQMSLGAPQVDGATVGLWHLDETSGTGAYIKDSTANANHGTPTGTSVVDGFYGKARSFNGSAEYITVNNTVTNFGTSNFTAEAWIKTSVSGTLKYIMTKRAACGHESFWSLHIPSSNVVGAEVDQDASGTNYINASGSTSVTDGNWHHIALVRSGSSIFIYVDGKQDGSGSAAGTANISNSANFVIGRSPCTGDFNGTMDEIRISNTPRTAEEIAEAYRAGRDHRLSRTITSTDLSAKGKLPFWVAADRPGTYLEATIGESAYANYEPDANTLALYHLEEETGSGAYIKDSSGNANHATPQTSPTFVAGKFGKARQMRDDTNDYIDPGTDIDIGNAWTVDTWFYSPINDTSSWRTLTRGTGGDHQIIVNTGAYDLGTYDNTGGTGFKDCGYDINVLSDGWHHLSVTQTGGTTGTMKFYIDGQYVCTISGYGSTTDITAIGNYQGGGQPWGTIDEFRVSDIERSADEIRQAYEVGRRTHPITVDFAAKGDSGNLITGSGDTSFTVDATVYGLDSKGSNLFETDKIIVRENVDGTEYLAQGDVTAVTASTGAVTVDAWDSGSTFPTGGYTANATFFKWQRENFDITGPLDAHINATTRLTLRVTSGSEGRTVWLDDFESAGDYLTTPGGSTITSTVQRYFQYRAILSSSDTAVGPSVTSVTLNYTDNVAPNTPTLDSPANTATGVSLTPALKTTATDNDSDNLQYKIELDTVSTFDSGNLQTFDQTASQTGWSGQNADAGTTYTSGTQATYTVQSALSAGTTYYWRSYAIDPAGTNTFGSTQGTPFSFTTSQTPTAPTSLLTEGQTNPTDVIDLTPEFSAIYNDPDTGDIANYYQVQVNTRSDFTGTSMWNSGQTSMTNTTQGTRTPDISYAGTALSLDESTFYWRIRLWDDEGNVSPYSATAQFTMANLVAPTSCRLQEAVDDSSITVVWTDTNSVETGYEVERSVNAGAFANITTTAANATSHQDTGVSQGNTYQYRVRAAESTSGSTSPYCTTATLSLQSGTFELKGVNLKGVNLK